MLAEIGINVALVVFYSVGIIILVGCFIAVLEKILFKLCGRKSLYIILITGLIGTPIHECGHALFCLIFGHKIEEFKPYAPDLTTGVMGYVNHSYKKKNFYQFIGNFFIGIGPILFGTGLLIGMLALMANNVFDGIVGISGVYADAPVGLIEHLKNLALALWGTIKLMFQKETLGNGWWWLYLIIGGCIALHMDLSKADIKSSWLSGIIITLTIAIVSFIVGLISTEALQKMSDGLFVYATFMACFITMAIMAFITMFVIILLFRLIRLLFKKQKKTA